MSYVRDRSVEANYPVTTTIDNPAIHTQTRDPRRFRLERKITGNVNPKWREQVAAHVNATTPLTGAYESVDSTPLIVQERVGYGLPSSPDTEKRTIGGEVAAYYYLPNSINNHPSASIDPSRAVNIAMSKALKQIRSSQVSMSGAVFLGELKEAIHMLRHPAEGLRKALKETYLDKLKRLKQKDPNKWKKAISQSWLEGCFGWRPFINDLEDAGKAYQEIQSRLADRYDSMKAVGKDAALIESRSELFAPVADTNIRGTMRKYEEAICVIRGEVKALAVTTNLDKARVFGLSPGEFLPTAWELCPWSFLIDYFTNIGDIIENAITDTASVAWLEMSTITKARTDAECHADWYSNWVTKHFDKKWLLLNIQSSSLKYKRSVVSRTGVVNLRVPPLMFELPGSPIKQLNMVALFTQANSISTQDPRKLRGRSFR